MPARAPQFRLILRRLLAVLLGLSYLPSSGAPDSGADASEVRIQVDEVKKLYLLQLGNFVDWPAAASSPPEFIIGLIAPDPFAGQLHALATDRKVQNRTVRVRLIREPEDLLGCHLVFVPQGTAQRWHRPLADISRHPILIVGEEPGFASRLGIVGFVVEQKNLRLEINTTAAEAAGLRPSSRLLRLARIVQTANAEEGRR